MEPNENAAPLLRWLAHVAFFSALLTGMTAAAQEETGPRDAAKHFQRGVALYGEADYRAALVEFKRAYALAPNVAVLFNVGEAEYQLQDYAHALATFGHYLAQAPSADGRRAEVESTVEVLRTRVGRLTITTSPLGADVVIDDQAVGRTPLEQPVVVSVGNRKIVASLGGHVTVTRYVEVAAEDAVTVSITLPAAETAAVAARVHSLEQGGEVATVDHGASGWRTAGWIATSAVAAGAIGSGIMVLKSSNDLAAARAEYPTSRTTLDKDASTVKTFAAVADSLTVAAVVLGGLTLYSTLSSSAAPTAARHDATSARVWLSPTSAHFALIF